MLRIIWIGLAALATCASPSTPTANTSTAWVSLDAAPAPTAGSWKRWRRRVGTAPCSLVDRVRRRPLGLRRGRPGRRLSLPPPVPRTLSADLWRRLDDGLLLARQPRVDWATLLRRTFAEDVLSCPKCRGRMALIEVLTDEPDIRRNLASLGLPYAPVSFAPPRDADDPPRPALRPTSTRGPPIPAADLPDGADPPLLDESADAPWHDDRQLPLDDDASQVSPDAEI